MEKLPERWAAERTPENYKQVNEFFNAHRDAPWPFIGDRGYVHSEKLEIAVGTSSDGWQTWFGRLSGYELLTDAQFMQLAYDPWKRAQNSDGWVKCSVRNPNKDNNDYDYKYIVFDPKDISDDKIVIAFYWPIKGEWTNDYGDIMHPTHWRELPAPPIN